MIFVYNLCPASRKCQYLTSGFERCDGAQVCLLLEGGHGLKLNSRCQNASASVQSFNLLSTVKLLLGIAIVLLIFRMKINVIKNSFRIKSKRLQK